MAPTLLGAVLGKTGAHSIDAYRMALLNNGGGACDAGSEELSVLALAFYGEKFSLALSAGFGLFLDVSDTHMEMHPSSIDGAVHRAMSWYTPRQAHVVFVWQDHTETRLGQHWGARLPPLSTPNLVSSRMQPALLLLCA